MIISCRLCRYHQTYESVELHANEYFGAKALHASSSIDVDVVVMAKGPVECLRMDKENFEELIHPVLHKLKRQSDLYHRFVGSKEMSPKFRVYGFLVFRKILAEIFSCSWFQLCKEMHLITLDQPVMLKKMGTHTDQIKHIENCTIS